MKVLSYLLLFVLISACCPQKNCIDGQIKVIPYYNGKYQLPSVPIKNFYVVTHTNPGHRLDVVSFGNENLNCRSDVSSVILNCGTKYKFSLYVAFDNPEVADIKLDSAITRVCGKNNCFIFDVDPHHN